MKKLAVIMTYYNENKELLKEALDSTIDDLNSSESLNSDYCIYLGVDREIESIPPKELDYLKELENLKKLKVIFFDENRGLASTLNDLIFNYCQDYEYIARMDADDVVLKGRFESQINYLNENPDVSLVGGQANKINEDGVYISDFKPRENICLDWGCDIIHPTWLVRTELYSFLNGYRELDAAQDYDLICRASINGYKVINLETKLINYRIRNGSIGLSRKFTQVYNKCLISKSYRNGKVAPLNKLNKNSGASFYMFNFVEKSKLINVYIGRLFGFLSPVHVNNYYLQLRKRVG
ncbi:TPA: glycosyltransferase [Vibrio parahaemolyticus]|nr:glycosyltransferase [Vibrio parahaemolyticus]EJG1574962.1 glycosyltransferase [Vibrio parahaemolyticus]HAS6683399.1 glycosyltransferase [Vibrio parahaemolyticus]HAS6693942.1 glycosyltransferase [Vibrio parahaemolyticus]